MCGPLLQELCDKYEVVVVPTFVAFKGGDRVSVSRSTVVLNVTRGGLLLSASLYVSKRGAYYGRPLSVSGRPCYILPMFF